MQFSGVGNFFWKICRGNLAIFFTASVGGIDWIKVDRWINSLSIREKSKLIEWGIDWHGTSLGDFGNYFFCEWDGVGWQQRSQNMGNGRPIRSITLTPCFNQFPILSISSFLSITHSIISPCPICATYSLLPSGHI